MLFFAFSTIIGWYFFGESNIKYLFGSKAVRVYSIIVCVCVLLGTLGEVAIVWTMSDMFNGLMVIPNLIGLLALTGVIKAVHNEYIKNDEMEESSDY
jgi:AGCS family alanine or glycine:cation symporter